MQYRIQFFGFKVMYEMERIFFFFSNFSVKREEDTKNTNIIKEKVKCVQSHKILSQLSSVRIKQI